jgi:peroxiredoxin Q/BCP
VEACNLRDNYSLLQQSGIVVLGVSPDNEKKHKKFEKKFNLPFTLVVDEDKKIANKFGVWGEKKLFGIKYMGLQRTTFVINEKGIIKKIFLTPKSKMHSEEILKAWQAIDKQKAS